MTDLSLVDSAFDSVGSAGEAALDTVVGGAAMAVDTASRPRRAATRARRRGRAATEELVDTAVALPERAVLAYLRGLRRQARRNDPIGAAARVILGAVHGPAGDWARFLARVERETDVRARAGGRRPSAARATAARRSSTRGTAARRSTGTRRRTSR